jgi:hypothetical protein
MSGGGKNPLPRVKTSEVLPEPLAPQNRTWHSSVTPLFRRPLEDAVEELSTRVF